METIRVHVLLLLLVGVVSQPLETGNQSVTFNVNGLDTAQQPIRAKRSSNPTSLIVREYLKNQPNCRPPKTSNCSRTHMCIDPVSNNALKEVVCGTTGRFGFCGGKSCRPSKYEPVTFNGKQVWRTVQCSCEGSTVCYVP